MWSIRAIIRKCSIKGQRCLYMGMTRIVKRIVNATRQYYWTIRAKTQIFVSRQAWTEALRVRGPLGLSVAGSLKIGENVTITNSSNYNRSGVNHPTQLVSAKGAPLKIGSNVGMSGSSIVCHQHIEIVKHVLLGVNALIYDSDLRPMNHMERRSSGTAMSTPVYIEDDVWLGARSIIAANSVVTKDIPSDTIAAGVLYLFQ